MTQTFPEQVPATNIFPWLPNTAIQSELVSATTYCEIAKFFLFFFFFQKTMQHLSNHTAAYLTA